MMILLDNVKQQDKATLKNVFLVHGEGESMKLLANSLEEEGYTVTIPEKDVPSLRGTKQSQTM
jgi:metallo-beta-lactamase family protein